MQMQNQTKAFLIWQLLLGSKTTELSAIMNNTGKIVANEIDKIRFDRLNYNIKMQGASNIETINKDGTILWKIFPEQFDKVLLDTPCSGEGRFEINDRKSYQNWSTNLVKNLVKTQKPKTFSEFVAALYQTGIDKNNFGLLLGRYRVVADTITVTKQWSEDNPPSFTWSTFSGSTYFPFNQFDLCFEVGGTLVHKATNLTATGNAITYTPSKQIWKKIYTYDWKYLLIQFYFVARQTSAPSSGNYYSQVFYLLFFAFPIK